MGADGRIEIYDYDELLKDNLLEKFRDHYNSYTELCDKSKFLNKNIIYYYWDTEHHNGRQGEFDYELEELFEKYLLDSYEVWT